MDSPVHWRSEGIGHRIWMVVKGYDAPLNLKRHVRLAGGAMRESKKRTEKERKQQ